MFVAEHAVDVDTTLVVYIGLGTLPSLAQKSMDHGLPCDTPTVTVERATTAQQRTVSNQTIFSSLGFPMLQLLDVQVFAELEDFATEIQSAELVSLTFIIIGNVVELSLLWPHCSKESFSLVETR